MSASLKNVRMAKSENKSKKETLQDIKSKAKLFLEDVKNANNLIDILTFSEGEEREIILACIRALHRIFSHLLSTRKMFMESVPQDEDGMKDLSKEDQYKIWLRERYAETRQRLLEVIIHEDSNVREIALCTLMKMVESEGQCPLKKITAKHLSFPTVFFEQIVVALLNDSVDLTGLIGRFQEFLEYDDVRYYAMKNCLKEIKDKQSHSEVFLVNVYTLLENLSMPQNPPDDDRLTKMMSSLPESSDKLKMCSHKAHKKMFATVWLEFMRCKLPTSLYKKILNSMHDKVMPHMSNPLLLSDFLTESYNIGGVISLLALHGLFILVNKYNLEYPDFFKKLYALLEPSVFHVKYKARFFYLLDLFLTSTHLPGYLVAAFAKRLARVSLTAPPSGHPIILPFIYNLIRRHPNLKVLLHKPEGVSALENDPYNAEETDPVKCGALESSLWEIKTLQSHYYHGTATEAKLIEQNLPKLEVIIGDFLETTTNDLFEKEIKKKLKEVPITFDKPYGGIFGNKEDIFKQFWSL